MPDNDQYFASLPTEELGKELSEKVSSWNRLSRDTVQLDRAMRAYRFYYGRYLDRDSSQIVESGIEGEMKMVNMNHFRNVIQHVLVMTTGERPHFFPQAENTDLETIEKADIDKAVINKILFEDRKENAIIQAVESALLVGEGYIRVRWDFHAGDLITMHEDEETETEVPLYAGKVDLDAPLYGDVIRDPGTRGGPDSWVMVPSYVNKWDLAAIFTEHRDAIVNTSSNDNESESQMRDTIEEFQNLWGREHDDYIKVWDFYHRKSAAVVDGRQTRFLADGTVLTDEPLPLDWIPVFRLSPSEQLGTNQGYTPAFDALSIQQLYDALNTIIASNQAATGIPTILLPPGFEWRGIVNGLSIYEVPGGGDRPETLQLTSTPAEIFQFMQSLPGIMETLMGLNSVVRGQPDPQFKSGSSLAMMQALAIKFNSFLQSSYKDMLESTGKTILWFMRQYADREEVAQIVGKKSAHELRSWDADDSTPNVRVELGNPLTRTVSGRKEIADDLFAKGVITDGQALIEVIETGNLDVATEDVEFKKKLIREENEKLSRGEPVQALATDEPIAHIQGHASVLSTPDARQNTAVVEAALAHIQEHVEQMKTTDPVLLIASGMDPNLVQMIMQFSAPPQPVPAPQAPPPAPGDPLSPGAEDLGLEQAGPADLPNLPQLPVNPATGERVPAPGGATVDIPEV